MGVNPNWQTPNPNKATCSKASRNSKGLKTLRHKLVNPNSLLATLAKRNYSKHCQSSNRKLQSQAWPTQQYIYMAVPLAMLVLHSTVAWYHACTAPQMFQCIQYIPSRMAVHTGTTINTSETGHPRGGLPPAPLTSDTQPHWAQAAAMWQCAQ